MGGGGGAVATVAFQNPPENVVTDTTPLTLDFEPAAVEIGGNRYCLRTWNGSVPAPTIRVPASASARSIRVDVNNTFTQTDSGIVMFGGGMKKGFIYGKSDATATEPEEDALSVEDWATTVYNQLGIVADKELMAPGDRPIEIVNGGKVRNALLA